MSHQTQHQQQIVKVTMWRNGSIYKTKTLGNVWVPESVMEDHEKMIAVAKEHGGDFLFSMPTGTPHEECIRTVALFEMYDVLQIDWREGKGWQDYVTLKSESEFQEATAIVKGKHCQSMPHWIERTAVAFRIVNPHNKVKVTE